jgi:hypothetical protein
MSSRLAWTYIASPCLKKKKKKTATKEKALWILDDLHLIVLAMTNNYSALFLHTQKLFLIH